MKTKVLLSAVIGVLFGAIGWLVMWCFEVPYAVVYAVMAGVLMYLGLFLWLVLYDKWLNARYASVEQHITSPIFYKANGNFNLGGGKIKNGNIYFCEDGIVCICPEDKPYTLDELMWQNIAYIGHNSVHLHIVMKDDRLFVITLPDAERVIKLLREKGYV